MLQSRQSLGCTHTYRTYSTFPHKKCMRQWVPTYRSHDVIAKWDTCKTLCRRKNLYSAENSPNWSDLNQIFFFPRYVCNGSSDIVEIAEAFLLPGQRKITSGVPDHWKRMELRSRFAQPKRATRAVRVDVHVCSLLKWTIQGGNELYDWTFWWHQHWRHADVKYFMSVLPSVWYAPFWTRRLRRDAWGCRMSGKVHLPRVFYHRGTLKYFLSLRE